MYGKKPALTTPSSPISEAQNPALERRPCVRVLYPAICQGVIVRRVLRDCGRLARFACRVLLSVCARACFWNGQFITCNKLVCDSRNIPLRTPNHFRNLGLREFWKLFDAYLNRALLVSRRPPQPVPDTKKKNPARGIAGRGAVHRIERPAL